MLRCETSMTDAERTEDERLERVINLLASGRWYGPATAQRLATEWGASVAYVNRMAQKAAAMFSAAS